MENKNWIKILIIFLIGLLAGYLFAVQTGGSEDIEEVSEVLLGEEGKNLEEDDDTEANISVPVITPPESSPIIKSDNSSEIDRDAVDFDEENPQAVHAKFATFETISVNLEDHNTATIVVTNEEGEEVASGSSVVFDEGQSYLVTILGTGVGVASPSIVLGENSLVDYRHLPVGEESIAAFRIENREDSGNEFHKIDLDIEGDGEVELNLTWTKSIDLEQYTFLADQIIEDSNFAEPFKDSLQKRLKMIQDSPEEDIIDDVLTYIDEHPSPQEDRDAATRLFEAMKDLI